ncbi:MAG: hypothetical protein JWM41_3866 [Gemmatimonadetes bacterium]|nr:hypothetical protein [Gemmatimonadota bacterium]
MTTGTLGMTTGIAQDDNVIKFSRPMISLATGGAGFRDRVPNGAIIVEGSIDTVAPKVTHLSCNEVAHAYSRYQEAQRMFGDSAPVTLEDGVAAWESRTFTNKEIQPNSRADWKTVAHG